MTKSRHRWALLLLLAITIVAASLSAPQSARAEDPAKVLLLLDVSGSMNERISSGGTKFAAAKRALKQVADALPAGTEVGLRVYGSEISEPKESNPEACRDTELMLPIGPLNRDRMHQAVDSFKAVGETPIAYSLGKAVDDLGEDGRRILILISDGEESCAGDPCPVVKKLADKGVDLQFNAIGIDVGGKARKQLKCIAEAGDGSYYDADQADDLSEALRKITQRALRPYAISGTPVTGTQSPEEAPELAVGQYQDRFGANDGERYYRVGRRPGETITASVNSLVPPSGIYNAEDWYLKLTTEGGQECDSVRTLNETRAGTLVVSGAVVSGQQAPECLSDPLVLSVERRSDVNTKDARAEIVISAEPEVVNMASLPGPVTSVKQTGSAVPDAKPVRRTVGGVSFTDAPSLAPGTYRDAPAVGESVFYKVRLQTGQRLRTTVTAPADSDGWDLTNTESVLLGTVLYSPSRVPLTMQKGFLQGDGSDKLTAYSPEVRVRNREIAHGTLVRLEGDARAKASYASIAGEYYVSFQVRPSSGTTSGRVLPIELNIDVDGTPEGQPQYATSASPTPSASPSASVGPPAEPSNSAVPDDPPADGPGAGALVLAAAVGAAVAVLAGLGVALAIRRSRAARATAKRDG